MSKLENLEFVEVISRFDIIMLSECWLSKNCKPSLSGYKCFKKYRKRHRRSKRNSGGVCIFIRESIFKGFENHKWEQEDSLIFKINKNFFFR